MFWRRASPVVCSGLLFGPPSFFRRGRRRDWRIRSDVFGNEVRVFSGPAACAFDSDDDCVVEEPVEVGRRDDGGSEDVAPLCEASVRGEDHRAFFATRICDLEEQARAALRDGQATVSSTTRITARAKKRIFFGEFGKGRLVDALSGFDGGDTTGLTQAAPFAAGSPTGHNGGRPQTPSRRRRAQARRRRSTPAQLGNG